MHENFLKTQKIVSEFNPKNSKIYYKTNQKYSQHDIPERDRQNRDEIDQTSLIVPEKDDLNQLIDYNDDAMTMCDDEVPTTMAFDCMDLQLGSSSRGRDDSENLFKKNC